MSIQGLFRVITRIVFYGFVGTCLLIASSCNNENESVIVNWDGGLIKKQGIYKLQDQQYTIYVEIDSNRILHYSVQDTTGIEIIRSVEHPSALQRWCLFWDHNENLWVESSDIGGFVWKKDDNGKYQQQPIVDDVELYRQMPQEIFDCLPTSIRKKWEVERSK